MIIIPAVDIMDGQVVRLYKGDPSQKTVYGNNPVEIAKKWQDAGADMLHIVDLDATLGRGSNLNLIKTIVGELSIPVQVAGGLRDESIINQVLEFSNRVVIGTLAFNDTDTLQKILKSQGKERIVISVDHKDGIIAINGWQNSTDVQLFDGINNFVEMGCSDFLLTNISRDGTLEGPDLESLKKACNIKTVNIISSGGISNIDDVKKVKECNPYGVILGKALYENKITIEEALQTK